MAPLQGCFPPQGSCSPTLHRSCQGHSLVGRRDQAAARFASCGDQTCGAPRWEGIDAAMKLSASAWWIAYPSLLCSELGEPGSHWEKYFSSGKVGLRVGEPLKVHLQPPPPPLTGLYQMNLAGSEMYLGWEDFCLSGALFPEACLLSLRVMDTELSRCCRLCFSPSQFTWFLSASECFAVLCQRSPRLAAGAQLAPGSHQFPRVEKGEMMLMRDTPPVPPTTAGQDRERRTLAPRGRSVGDGQHKSVLRKG